MAKKATQKQKKKKPTTTTALIILTLILLPLSSKSLQTITLDEDRNQKVRISLKKKKTLKIELSNSAISDLDNKEQTLFYTLKAELLTTVILSSKRTSEAKEGIVHLIDNNGKETGVFSSTHKKIWDEVKENKVLYLTIKNEDVESRSQSVDINISLSDAYYISNLDEFKLEKERIFDLRKSKRIPIKIRFQGKNDKSFLKIISTINEKGNLNIFGKLDKVYGGDVPTESEADFTMMRFSDEIYAHVLDKGNAKDCYSGFCFVKIVIEAGEKLSYCGFTATPVEEFEDISEFTQIPDHITGKGTRIYKFSSKNLRDLEVNLKPIEGDGKLYVNPGSLPKDPTKSMYKLEAKANKRILIPKWNFEAMKAKNITIFIQVVTETMASFMLETNLDDEPRLNVKPGMVESGELQGNETKTHYLYVENLTGIKHDFNIRLHIISGSADLYMKECKEEANCVLTKEDLTAKETLLFKKSVQKGGIRNIRFPVFCDSKGDGKPPAGYGISRTGLFAIFIKSMNENGAGKVHYELSIEDTEMDTLLVRDHFLRTKLRENEVKYFYYNFRNKGRKVKNNLQFVFDGVYGKFDICIVQSPSRPKDLSKCAWNSSIDSSNHIASAKTKQKKFDTPQEGKYFIAIKAETSSELSIGTLQGKQGNDEDPHTFVTRSLKAGVSTNGKLTPESQVRYYSFKLSLPQHVEAISVNLLPKTGKYVISIRNDGNLPTLDQKFWVSYDNEIMIDNNDPLFNTNKRYVVAVRPFITDDSKSDKISQDHEFEIKFSYTDNHSVLTAGIPESGSLQRESQCFVIQNYNAKRGIFLGKSVVTRSLNMFVNIGGDNFKPDYKQHDFYVKTHEVGVYIDETKINKKCSEKNKEIEKEEGKKTNSRCHIYACLRGNMRDRYTIYYIQGNQPLIATKNSILDLPIPKAGESVHVVYHPETNKDLYVELNAMSYYAGVYSICMTQEEANKKEKRGLYPTLKNFQKKSGNSAYSKGLFYKSEELQKIKNPVCLISILSTYRCSSPQNSPFCAAGEVSLEFNTDLKEIKKSSPTDILLPDHEMKYFYFYNSEPNIPLEIDISTEGNGYVVAFVDKGKEKRPVYGKALRYSWHFAQSPTTIKITEGDVKARGYKDLRGYYVVGLMAYTKPFVKAVVTWKHETNKVTFLSYSNEYAISATNGEDKYAEFRSYYGNKPIELNIFGDHSDFDIYVKKVDYSTQVTLGEYNEFPTEKSFDYKFSVRERHSYRRFIIKPEEQSGVVRYLFMFKSQGEFSNFKILINVKGMTTYMWGNKEVIGYIDEDFNDPPEYHSSFYKGSLLQIDINIDATLEFYPTYVPKGEKKTRTRVPISKGYNFVDVSKELGKASSKKQRRELLIYNGFFHHYVQLRQENFRILCPGACEYKMKVINPENYNYLPLNTFSRGIIPPGLKSMKYEYYVNTPYFKKLSLRVRILRAYKKVGNRIEYVPFEIKEADVKKLLKVSYNSNTRVVLGRDVNSGYNLFENLKLHLRNNEIYTMLKPNKGRYRVEIFTFDNLELKFEIEMATNDYGDLQDGAYMIEKINMYHPKEEIILQKKDNKKIGKFVTSKNRYFGFKNYEYDVKEPGKVKINIHRCFGKLSLEGIGPGGAKYEEEEVEDRNGSRIFDVEKPGKLFIRVRAADEDLFEKYKKVMKKDLNNAVYNIEAHEENSEYPFKGITTGRIAMKFTGSKPTLNFEDLSVPVANFDKYNYKIRYTIVSTIMPELLEYYNGCNDVYLKEMFDDHFKKNILDSYLNIKTLEVVWTNNKFVGPKATVQEGISWLAADNIPRNKIELDLRSGERYHASVFADLVATPKSFEIDENFQAYFDKNQQFTRIHYKIITFDTSTFAAPIEIISAIVGLIAIVVISCGLIGKTITGFVSKISGFQALKSEVDDDLESYFMKMKKKGEMLEAGLNVEESFEGEYAVEDVGGSRTKKEKEEIKIAEAESDVKRVKEVELQESEVKVGEKNEKRDDSDDGEGEVDIEMQIKLAQERYEAGGEE